MRYESIDLLRLLHAIALIAAPLLIAVLAYRLHRDKLSRSLLDSYDAATERMVQRAVWDPRASHQLVDRVQPVDLREILRFRDSVQSAMLGVSLLLFVIATTGMLLNRERARAASDALKAVATIQRLPEHEFPRQASELAPVFEQGRIIGLLVNRVEPGSILESAGIEPGTRIVSWGREQLDNATAISRAIDGLSGHEVGKPVEVEIVTPSGGRKAILISAEPR